MNFYLKKISNTNASNWKLNLERINRISIDNQIEFIQILQPTLGVKSDPEFSKRLNF